MRGVETEHDDPVDRGGRAATGAPPKAGIFARIVCGIDGSDRAVEAARQAAVLAPSDAELLLVEAFDRHTEDQLEFAHRTLRQAREVIAPIRAVRTRAEPGRPGEVLLSEIRREAATLLALGVYYRSRLDSVLSGGVEARLLHRAPCSVLMARTPTDPEGFPRAVVVGLDGSPDGAAALAAAQELSGRLGRRLTAVTAIGDTTTDLDAIREQLAPTPEIALLVDDRPPLAALSELDEADLLVVGSRGLRGPRAVGSVSERLAHQAQSSVLVVRSAHRAD